MRNEDLVKLLNQIQKSKNKTIEITDQRFDDENAKLISETLSKNKMFLEISIIGAYRNPNITDIGAELLFKALLENNIKRVSLFRHHITSKSAPIIAKFIKENKTLEMLDLQDIQIDLEGLKIIFNALAENTTLKTLRLNECKLTEEDSLEFGEALEQLFLKNTCISKISFKNNSLNDQFGESLARIIFTNTTVKSINCNSNKISDKSAKSIANALKENTTLESLKLENNNIEKTGLDCLAQVLRTQFYLTRFEFRMRIHPTGLQKTSNEIESYVERNQSNIIKFKETLSELSDLERQISNYSPFNTENNFSSEYLKKIKKIEELEASADSVSIRNPMPTFYSLLNPRISELKEAIKKINAQPNAVIFLKLAELSKRISEKKYKLGLFGRGWFGGKYRNKKKIANSADLILNLIGPILKDKVSDLEKLKICETQVDAILNKWANSNVWKTWRSRDTASFANKTYEKYTSI